MPSQWPADQRCAPVHSLVKVNSIRPSLNSLDKDDNVCCSVRTEPECKIKYDAPVVLHLECSWRQVKHTHAPCNDSFEQLWHYHLESEASSMWHH